MNKTLHDIPIEWIERELSHIPAPIICIGPSPTTTLPHLISVNRIYDALHNDLQILNKASLFLPYVPNCSAAAKAEAKAVAKPEAVAKADIEAIHVLKPPTIVAIYDITGYSHSPQFHLWMQSPKPYVTTHCDCVKTSKRVTALRVWRRLDTITDPSAAIAAIACEQLPYKNVWQL